ncbi:MAG: DMT family transporter [Gammaproteobacteria bacterium]|nr:DMT family transporter [Gammaproteobacteria bacterium]MDA8007736.1 DMT family transporter [Gammaproteobacteria bacterium]MDA8011212.1 DMT family transporter [Gammaproteobacteria bacterium]MDA8021692.1 DMT family transporter [Gammaproteobacteria bacterium]
MKNFSPATLLLSGLFVLCWSSGFVGAAYGLDYAGTFTLLFWRYLLLAAFLAALTTLFRAWRRLSAREIFRHAFIGILAHAVWLVAVLYALDLGVSAGIAAFITALQPMVTAALAVRITGERIRPMQWCGIALGLASVAIVVSDKVALGGSLFGYLLPFAAVLAISLSVVLDRRAGKDRAAPPILLTTTIHASASLAVIAPLAWGVEGFDAQFGAPLVFAVVWLALVVSLGAYGLMFMLLRRTQASKVSGLTYLSPPVTLILGYLVFGDVLRAADLVALVVAAIAVALVLRSPRLETAPCYT